MERPFLSCVPQLLCGCGELLVRRAHLPLPPGLSGQLTWSQTRCVRPWTGWRFGSSRGAEPGAAVSEMKAAPWSDPDPQASGGKLVSDGAEAAGLLVWTRILCSDEERELRLWWLSEQLGPSAAFRLFRP